MTVGERIRQARISQGITVSGLAEAAGLTKGFISQVESGRSNPSMLSLDRIAHSLHVPPAALLDDLEARSSGEPPSRPPLVARAWTTTPEASRLQFMGSEDHRKRYIVSLLPGASLVPAAIALGSGRITAVVVEGEFEFSQSPIHSLLGAGDVVTWDGSRRYHLGNTGGTTARLFLELAEPCRVPLLVEPANRRDSDSEEPALISAEGPLRLAAMRARRHGKAAR